MSDRKIISLYDTSPESLLYLSLEAVVSRLDEYIVPEVHKQYWKFKDGIVLPAEICEKLLEVYQRKNRVNDKIASLFRDRSRTRLDLLYLRNSKITIDGLRWFLEHKPKVVDLTQCEHMSQAWLHLINGYTENLITLKFGPIAYVPDPKQTLHQQRCSALFVVNAPKLRRVTVQCRGSEITPMLMSKPLRRLTHLDLSDFTSPSTTWALHEFENLRSLVLHSVLWSIEVIQWICGLRYLRHLDISQTNDRTGTYFSPNETLARFVTNLPFLESLDISGTNLAGNGTSIVSVIEDPSNGKPVHVHCDIPGLVSRVNKPLEFLGLYGTHYGACKRHDIPAKVITGDANEEQILTAGVVYLERPVLLIRVLSDLYYKFRSTETYTTLLDRALSVVLNAMEHHPSEQHIQISGCAILFYIVKGKEKHRFSMKLKQRIISTLLDAMEANLEDDTMMRNGCLTLCQFKIPSEVIFEYERVVQILLHVVGDLSQEDFVQRIAIYLLNSLACQVGGWQKQFLGTYGAIGKMLNLISERLKRFVCDDVMEVAWSTMWNVTDETPVNCQRFLDSGGMKYFLACLKNFPDKEELLRNMMGLLGNVAEVADLRPQLMDQMFLNVFYELLNSSSDGIEVSYNAAGVLAHMASDGPAAWSVEEPSRAAVLLRLALAVQRWDRMAERNINYRSFGPILSLLRVDHTPQCQHWAVWALANLTSVYPVKYCDLIKEEGGLKLLQEVVASPKPYQMIKDLAQIAIDNCVRYQGTQNPPLPPP